MFARVWRRVESALEGTSLWLVVLFALVIAVMFWHIGSVPPGMSPAEKVAVAESSSLSAIWNWPLNAPHKLLQYGLQSLGCGSAGWMRSISAVFGVLISLCLYTLVKNWFGRFIGALSVLLLVGTPLFLILARSATPQVMLLVGLLPLAWFVASKQSKSWLIFNAVFLVLCAAAIYSPGVIWPVLLAGIFWRRNVVAVLGRVPRPRLILSAGLFVVLIAPLLFSLADINFLRQWLLFPQYMPQAVEVLKNVGWAPMSFVFRTSAGSQFLVGTSAIFGLTQIVFMVLGIIAMVRQAAREAIWLSAFASLGIILYVVNGVVTTLLLSLPPLIIFAAAGMRYLYTEWKIVFPKNPIPHFVAVLLLSLVCFQQLAYGVHYAYKAWPHSVQTKKLYVLK